MNLTKHNIVAFIKQLKVEIDMHTKPIDDRLFFSKRMVDLIKGDSCEQEAHMNKVICESTPSRDNEGYDWLRELQSRGETIDLKQTSSVVELHRYEPTVYRTKLIDNLFRIKQ